MFIPTKRTEGISSSDLIVRVLRDYDDYIWRNLKKNYKPEELGISEEYAIWLKMRKTYKNLEKKKEETKQKLVNLIKIAE